MMQRHGLTTIKRGILVFWAVWLSGVVATKVLDALKAAGALGPEFRFASGNWGWINQTMDPLGVPRGLQAAMFAGAVGWEATAAVLFWRAAKAYRGRPLVEEPAAVLACGA